MATGKESDHHPITAPFDWGLGSTSAPAPAEPVSAAELKSPDLVRSSDRAVPYFSSDSDEDVEPLSPIESLFGETKFRLYESDPPAGPIAAGLDPRSRAATQTSLAPSMPVFLGPSVEPGAEPPAAGPPRQPLSKNQKMLLWIASAVIALLVLTVLFVLGTKISPIVSPAVAPTPTAAAATKSATPKASPAPVPAGPAAVGSHLWSDLRGGECVDPYPSPFEVRYTVVDCAAPHPAQMVFRGTFPGDSAAAYPGLEALQSQLNLLCTAPGVINLATAGAYNDIQFQASYAATAEEWMAGQHDYFCFVNRAGGDPITGSVAGSPAK